MKKLIISIFSLLLLCTTLNAQFKHEFSIHAGGGLSTLNYDVTEGKQKMGFGGLAGLGYQFFFSENWGIGLGAEFALYNSKFDLPSLETHSIMPDGTTDFDFQSTIRNYEEKQTAGMLQIPLMLQFQSNGKNKFYIAAGGKVALPIMKDAESSGASLHNSGYYAYESYTYTTQNFRGFGTFNGRGSKGEMDLKAAFLASAELGMKWHVSDGMSLYTGAYLDYGLNNIANEKPAPFVEYERTDPSNFALNSIIHSQYTPRNVAANFTDKVAPLAIGIKLRLAFGCAKKEVKEASPVVITPTVDPDAEAKRLAAEEAARQAAEAKRLADEEAARQAAEAKRLADEEAARLAAEKAALQAIKDQIEQPIDHYNLSQTAPTAQQKADLDKKIELLKEYPDMDVFIYGHTCEIGGNDINEKVGLGRANNTKAYLISKGIDEKRITGTASKLDHEPIVPNTGEENRKQNRRVVIKVVN